jgi:hypothetical protein
VPPAPLMGIGEGVRDVTERGVRPPGTRDPWGLRGMLCGVAAEGIEKNEGTVELSQG